MSLSTRRPHHVTLTDGPPVVELDGVDRYLAHSAVVKDGDVPGGQGLASHELAGGSFVREQRGAGVEERHGEVGCGELGKVERERERVKKCLEREIERELEREKTKVTSGVSLEIVVPPLSSLLPPSPPPPLPPRCSPSSSTAPSPP